MEDRAIAFDGSRLCDSHIKRTKQGKEESFLIESERMMK